MHVYVYINIYIYIYIYTYIHIYIHIGQVVGEFIWAINGCTCMGMYVHGCIYVLSFYGPPWFDIESRGRRLGTQSKPKWVLLYPEASMSAAECHRQDIHIAVNLIHGLMNTGAILRDHPRKAQKPGQTQRRASPPGLSSNHKHGARHRAGDHSHSYTWRQRNIPRANPNSVA